MPGRFVSALDVRKDGAFSFSYKGEIIFEMPGGEQFPDKKLEVWDDQRAYCGLSAQGVAVLCSSQDIAAQKRDWEADRKFPQATVDSDTAQFIKIFGIDPRNENSFLLFAEELKKQKGWKHVKYLGNGVFDVEYAVSGRLEHDFMFPIFPKFNMVDPFVIIRVAEKGALHIETPALPGGTTRALASLLDDKPLFRGVPGAWRTFGEFTLTTDAVIESQNSGSVIIEETGGTAGTASRKVSWTINEKTTHPADVRLKLR